MGNSVRFAARDPVVLMTVVTAQTTLIEFSWLAGRPFE